MDQYDEEIVVFGTPFEPLQKTDAPKKQELDLTVRDEKGRRRFHGAFTGGFSAGYFNTVGTVEGWIPSQFKSTRSEKWDKSLVKHKPEDFMDEEDMGVFGIAHRTVKTTEKFAPSSSNFAGLRSYDKTSTITDLLKQIITPAHESIGVKLFKTMKRSLRGKNFQRSEDLIKETFASLQQTTAKSYGCSLPPEIAKSRSSVEIIEDPLEDSENTTPDFTLPYVPKVDFHGIGYQGISSDSASEQGKSQAISAVLSGGKRLKISGEAFGYGALHDEQDNEEDAQVYGKDDMSQYDFELGSNLRSTKLKTSNKLDSIEPKESLQGCFRKETLRTKNTVKFARPRIPSNWRPKPPFAKEVKKKSRWDQKLDKASDVKSSIESDFSKTELDKRPSNLDANVRAILLGEEVVKVVGTKSKAPTKNLTETTVNESFKPALNIDSRPQLSGFFASKFTSSSHKNEEAELEAGLTKADQIPEDKKKKKVVEEDVKCEIGTTKRESFQWHPHTLLCRRFNVPHPFPQFPDVVGILTVAQSSNDINKPSEIPLPSQPPKPKAPSSQAQQPNLFQHLIDDPISFSTPPFENEGSSKALKPKFPVKTKIEFVSDSSSDESSRESNHEEKPDLALFRAIFASDEESDGNDVEIIENNGSAEPKNKPPTTKLRY